MNYTKRQSYVARILFLVILSLLLLVGCEGDNQLHSTYNMKVTEATEEFYINDFSEIFTEEQKASMMEKAVNLDNDYAGIQVVITTVESLQKCVIEGNSNPSIEQVAYAMYNQYGIGQDDMGILVLFSKGDREVSIETGRQMQAYITDLKSGQLLDNYGMEYFKQDQFAEGLISLQDGIISEVKGVVPKDWNISQIQKQELDQETEETKQTEQVLASKDEVSKASEKEQGKAGLFAIFAVFGTMVYGLIELFSTKRELKEIQNERRQLEEKLQGRAESYERISEEVQREHKRELGQIETKYSEEIAKLKYAIRTYQNEINRYQKEVDYVKEAAKIHQGELEEKIEDLKGENSRLQIQLQELQEKLDRAQKLHPEFNLEAEIQGMIEKEFQEAAEKIDLELAQYLTTPAKDNNEAYFQFAITQYHSAKPEVKKYLKTDVNRLQSLYEESCTLHWKADAAKADQRFKQYLDTIVDKDNVPVFKRAIREYEQYSPEVQKYMVTDKKKLCRMYEESVSLKEKFEREEQERRAKSEAQSVYEVLEKVVRCNRNGTHENQQKLAKACRKYENMTTAAKSFFPDEAIIQTLRKLLREAKEDTENWEKAQKVENEIERIISRVGYSASEHDKDQLEKTLIMYLNLETAQQAYVSQEIIRKLKRLLEEAEEDERRNRRRREEERRRREEEQRRRQEEQRRSYNSFSSTGSSSHGGSFGGHGGRSGGGGASRHFK